MMGFGIDRALEELLPAIQSVWELSARKIRVIEEIWSPRNGAPVFTVQGRYVARGWTEWTQGFQFGSMLLQFDATGDSEFLDLGRKFTLERMAPHVTHFGVHDHGFNCVSTYGNLWRLIYEGRIPEDPRERTLCELALKASGAVQAHRWTRIADGGGFIHSFNGPHSLFADTIRSLRSLALAHRLGHCLLEEGDHRTSLLERLIEHARATARYNVYYGEGRDAYDVRGRVSHESLFNVTSGAYRCPSTQQGYSPFTTWTRGLAWAILGFAEELEFLDTVPDAELGPLGSREEVEGFMRRAAEAASDFYLANTPADGIPYWDTGAPGLRDMGEYLDRPADPYNEYEPVDSSAAAIAAQGLLRLGIWLGRRDASTPDLPPHPSSLSRPESESKESGSPCRSRAGGDRAAATDSPFPGASDQRSRTSQTDRNAAGRGAWGVGESPYIASALTIARTLFAPPYLSEDPEHQGLILHSVYHRPNGWDYVPPGRRIPCGESSMWGDYHARELALLIQRLARGEPYYAFFGPLS